MWHRYMPQYRTHGIVLKTPQTDHVYVEKACSKKYTDTIGVYTGLSVCTQGVGATLVQRNVWCCVVFWQKEEKVGL